MFSMFPNQCYRIFCKMYEKPLQFTDAFVYLGALHSQKPQQLGTWENAFKTKRFKNGHWYEHTGHTLKCFLLLRSIIIIFFLVAWMSKKQRTSNISFLFSSSRFSVVRGEKGEGGTKRRQVLANTEANLDNIVASSVFMEALIPYQDGRRHRSHRPPRSPRWV